MTFLPLGKTTLKSILATGLLAAMATPAMADDAAMQFSVESNATRTIGSSATAFERGEFEKSVAFSKYALKQGLKKSRKAAAYSNLCAALGELGEFNDAMEACNAAVEYNPKNWRALSNRAVLHAQAGNDELARADIGAAVILAADEPKLAHNQKILG
jgi:Flp pilus assembly protein TadD